jgi:hypothetical protein
MELKWQEKLRQHLGYCLSWCERTGNEICMHQAFGAVQFAVFEHPESEEEISKMWDDFKSQFERKIWGISLTI